MTAGTNALSLNFDGDVIGAHGKDGPYRVADLSVYPTTNDDAVGFLVTAHQTAAYAAADFVDPAPDALFLHNNPTPPVESTDAQADLPLTATEPTTAELVNYAVNLDGNAEVIGRFIDKTSYGPDELDLQKVQTWLGSPVDSAIVLSGDAQLHLWAKMKSPGKNLQLEAYLSECTAESCTLFATGQMVPVVGASASQFEEVTVSFQSLDATIDEGNQLQLRVIVLDIADADQTYLAYDTVSYPARLVFGD